MAVSRLEILLLFLDLVPVQHLGAVLDLGHQFSLVDHESLRTKYRSIMGLVHISRFFATLLQT